MKIRVKNTSIELWQGDITELDTDAIVNAANSQLVLGAGVAGAIRRKGGPIIQEECSAIGHCPVGGAVITSGGQLKARHVIHAVGPRMGEGDEETKLASATRHSLKCADDNHLASIALPAISAGIFGFPLEACARIMLKTAAEYCAGGTGLARVVFALYDLAALETFERALAELS